MPQPWIILPSPEPPPALAAAVGGHPLVARLLAQRGIDTPERAAAFLDPALYRPAPPTALAGVADSAELLCAALERGENVLVWGDFDVDGQTATALLLAALCDLAGPERVRFHVPNRFSEGHGIRKEMLAEVIAGLDVPIHVLLSCDTGIDEGQAVGFAKDQGLTVIVTDHHDPPAALLALPPRPGALWGVAAADASRDSVRRADAIVNPKFQPPGDPLRTLPGVGVAYKLAQQLYALCGRAGGESALLDLVALGIVADVAEQVHDARYLLQLGLERLRATRRAGLIALMEVARLEPGSVTADSVAFQLGPRMNAVGRLDDATTAVELLTTSDPVRARQLAAAMERLNQERRLLTSQTTATAMEMIDREPGLLDREALVLAHPSWHPGIVGVVASRLAEEFHKPAVLLVAPPNAPARGSARSVPGVDIGAAIAACAPHLSSWGGHPGAAGVSLPFEKIAAFRRELWRQVPRHRTPDAQTGLRIDVEAGWGDLSFTLAEELQRLAPFGQGNPVPRFLTRGLTITGDRRLGRDGAHRRLLVRSADDAQHSVLWFSGADAELPLGPVDLVYEVGINEFKGVRSLQLTFVALRAAEAPALPLEEPAAAVPPRRVHDLRGQPGVPPALALPADAVWYAEGVRITAGLNGSAAAAADGEISFAPRYAVAEAAVGRPLVLWSIPPSPELLRWLVETVQPRELYLCGRHTADDDLAGVVRHVAGMCKYAMQRDGLVDVARMAARLGSTEAAIRHALLWLESRGLVALVEWGPEGHSGDTARLAPGGAPGDPATTALLQAELEELLAEARAYRRYFARARLSELGLAAA